MIETAHLLDHSGIMKDIIDSSHLNENRTCSKPKPQSDHECVQLLNMVHLTINHNYNIIMNELTINLFKTYIASYITDSLTGTWQSTNKNRCVHQVTSNYDEVVQFWACQAYNTVSKH